MNYDQVTVYIVKSLHSLLRYLLSATNIKELRLRAVFCAYQRRLCSVLFRES